MELCKKVQAEEYVIYVEESTNFYTSLRFFLLASPWFPRPLGLALWSVLHMLVVLCMTLMRLAMFSLFFAMAVSFDAFLLCSMVLTGLLLCLCLSLVVVSSWIWLLISCSVPRREPGRALAHHILTAGGEVTLLQTLPADQEQTAAASLCDWDADYWQTARLVNHLKLVSIPYWRVDLGNLCREIVPTDDAVVI